MNVLGVYIATDDEYEHGYASQEIPKRLCGFAREFSLSSDHLEAYGSNGSRKKLPLSASDTEYETKYASEKPSTKRICTLANAISPLQRGHCVESDNDRSWKKVVPSDIDAEDECETTDGGLMPNVAMSLVSRKVLCQEANDFESVLTNGNVAFNIYNLNLVTLDFNQNPSLAAETLLCFYQHGDKLECPFNVTLEKFLISACIERTLDIPLGKRYQLFQHVHQASQQATPSPRILYALGRFYAAGFGTEKSIKSAAMFFYLAAAQGDAHAQFYLGGIYEFINLNPIMAAEWYGEAVKNNFFPAMFPLACCHYKEKNVQPCARYAFALCRDVAKRKEITSQAFFDALDLNMKYGMLKHGLASALKILSRFNVENFSENHTPLSYKMQRAFVLLYQQIKLTYTIDDYMEKDQNDVRRKIFFMQLNIENVSYSPIKFLPQLRQDSNACFQSGSSKENVDETLEWESAENFGLEAGEGNSLEGMGMT